MSTNLITKINSSKLVKLNSMLGEFLEVIAPDITEESVVEVRCNPNIAKFLAKVKSNYYNLTFVEIVADEYMDDASIELAHYDLFQDTDLYLDVIKL